MRTGFLSYLAIFALATIVLFAVPGFVLGAGNTTTATSTGNDSSVLVDTFVVVFIISFGAVALMAGLFTTYFGAGKSRMIGVVLTLIGLIILLLSGYFATTEATTGPINWGHVYILEAIIVIISAGLGAVVGVLLFLLAIMKA